MIRTLTTDELLDWLAVMEIDPWGPKRDDRRAAVSSLWNRGAKFSDVRIDYPHVGDENSDEEDDIVSMLEADRSGMRQAFRDIPEDTNRNA